MRRKRDSLRRWKARCRAGRCIPYKAIVEHRLGAWFAFEPVELLNADFYRVRLSARPWFIKPSLTGTIAYGKRASAEAG